VDPHGGVVTLSREEGEMGEKLFVGNLSFGTSDQDLRELFSTVGTCVSARSSWTGRRESPGASASWR
jgi:hypothetical protein